MTAGRDRAREPTWRTATPAAALALVWLAMLAWGGGSLDRSIYEALYAGHRPLLLPTALVLTFLGQPGFLIAMGLIVAALLWWRGRGRLALTLLLVVLVGRGLSEAQKYWVARVRPDLEPHLVVVKTSSFPSGHSASSMIFYLAIALTLTVGNRWHRVAAAAAILLSLAIGTSRVMLGVHWPSDVVGGWAFGLLWVLLALPLSERLLKA